MLLEIELEEIQTVDNPDDEAIAAAISRLEDKGFCGVRLRDDKEYISTFLGRQNSFEVTYRDHFGRVYANDSGYLSRETVIRMFRGYNRMDSSWEKETAWKDVTEELRRVKPVALFMAYVLMIVGVGEILFGWFARGLLGKINFALSILLGFVFSASGAVLWVVYKLKGREPHTR